MSLTLDEGIGLAVSLEIVSEDQGRMLSVLLGHVLALERESWKPRDRVTPAMTLTCPYCGAAPGVACISRPSGTPAGFPHADRLQAGDELSVDATSP